MNNSERLKAIEEVLKWVKSGKQDLQNGLEEIETINYLYTLDRLNGDDLLHCLEMIRDHQATPHMVCQVLIDAIPGFNSTLTI